MKKLHKRNQKGFTLIEILIVVVIIGVLAALVLPRMLSQPERAIIAEGHQYLGVIRRAQNTYKSSTGDTAYLAFSANVTGVTATNTNDEWSELGLDNLPASTAFSYTCSTTECSAIRDSGDFTGAEIRVNIDSGALTCTGTGGGFYTNSAGTTDICIPLP